MKIKCEISDYAKNEFVHFYNAVCKDSDVNIDIDIKEYLCDEEYEVYFDENTLFIRAGRIRAIYYAIYDYFNRAYGIEYFWDGDILPDKKVPFKTVSIHEKPRFKYRGMRYFAHRGLHRFNAEMWTFEDWKTEIDYLLKKRFNLFMLRIGLDDLFQKAFPDICAYPPHEGCLNDSLHGFDDRTSMWTLEYRSELRRKICEYANLHDLIQPVDCGTMTHWYSRTPLDFIKNETPDFFSQTTDIYADKTALVWDIRKEKNLENYFKLTNAYISAYGESGLFHTIGLAERLFSDKREDNLKLKIYTYKRICDFLKKNYPNSKLLIGSWDFSMYWKNDEVAALVKSLDKEQCIIFDYTSDTSDEVCNFTKWGIVNEFPYIFGVFHAYEPSNEIRGNYDRIENRISTIKSDEKCLGFVTWQELSHGDNFMLEYVADNAWHPMRLTIEKRYADYCNRRFKNLSKQFLNAYKLLTPISSLTEWGGDKENPSENIFNDYTFSVVSTAFLRTPIREFLTDEYRNALKKQYAAYESVEKNVDPLRKLLDELCSIPKNQIQTREWFDIKRTLESKVIHYDIIKLGLELENFRNGEKNEVIIFNLCKTIIEQQQKYAILLSSHSDFSLKDTILLLEKEHKVNPYFKEKTIKEMVFREGDKVMQTKNNYSLKWHRISGEGDEDGVGVFN
ncbi:MAG: alpha-N-acetylglucosaminidase TIM-barrel domain-containing protein, partial [Clostridia bacterium]